MQCDCLADLPIQMLSRLGARSLARSVFKSVSAPVLRAQLRTTRPQLVRADANRRETPRSSRNVAAQTENGNGNENKNENSTQPTPHGNVAQV